MVSMKPLKRFAARLLAATLFVVSSHTWATTVVATVSKNKVVKNEVFQLRIVVDKKVASDAIDLSSLEQNFYVGRPSFGSSVNIINGDRNTRSEWNISLAAQRLGEATIPAFTIDNAQSQPITIQVTMDSNEPVLSDLVELQSQLEKRELYPNESTTLTTRLIVKTDPRRLQNARIAPPSADGVSLTALGEPNQYQSVVDGVEVTVVDQNYRVTADKVGQYTVRGIGFNGNIIYGDDRRGTTKLVSANTPADTFTLTVLPIPEQYQGEWLPAAKLSLSQRWLDSAGNNINPTDTYDTRVGESISREITLDISGLPAERFPELAADYSDALRVYQQKPQFSQLADGTTRMTLKHVLLPQKNGQIAMDSLTLDWWDSANKQLQTAQINGLKLNVAAGNDANIGALLPAMPATPQTETVTVYQAGFWPYLTAFFALLWVATVMLYLKKPSAHRAVTELDQTHDADPSLINALNQQDFVRANLLLNSWLEAHQHLDPELLTEIKQHIATMNQHRFGAEQQPWQAKPLIKLIKRGERSKPKRKKDATLAPL
ncbi:BatD family protein [Vibrio sp. NH-UV-68]|uniref:BatD family protein n=1 Tax=unclassified Vibrio TaxID=2614977 RepID=UPI0036F295FE